MDYFQEFGAKVVDFYLCTKENYRVLIILWKQHPPCGFSVFRNSHHPYKAELHNTPKNGNQHKRRGGCPEIASNKGQNRHRYPKVDSHSLFVMNEHQTDKQQGQYGQAKQPCRQAVLNSQIRQS